MHKSIVKQIEACNGINQTNTVTLNDVAVLSTMSFK